MAIKRKAPRHPLAEVFGFPYDNLSAEATRHRQNRLCPFNNKVPSCTKDKVNDPLGVCSIFNNGYKQLAITCPVRFRENWKIAGDAAAFFFPRGTKWTSLAEVRLNERDDTSAGNIDLVLVSYDNKGRIQDFGALEIQAVYISGNIRRPFEKYMESPARFFKMNWKDEINYPRADYLSSSRKRLVPQLLYKGGILRAWNKKIAIAVHKGFFSTLPSFMKSDENHANVVFLVYDLIYNDNSKRFELKRIKTHYTRLEPAIKKMTKPLIGPIGTFIDVLQDKLDEQLRSLPPRTPTLFDLMEEEGE